MSIRDIFLAFAIVAIWGFNFVVIKVGVGEVPPLLLTGLRFLLAALPAIFFIERPKVRWMLLLQFGFVLGVIKFGLLFVSIHIGMPAGLASLVLQLQAFFTIAMAFFLLGEKPRWWQIAGGAVAFGGVAVIGAAKMHGASFVPFIMVIGAASMWGLANIIMKKAGKVNMLSFVVWACIVPPLPLFALSWGLEDHDAIIRALTHPSLMAIGSLAYLAYLATIVGFALWGNLLSRYPAATVAPFSLFVPVFGITSAAIVLGEPFAGASLVGGALVFAGLALNVFGARLRLPKRF